MKPLLGHSWRLLGVLGLLLVTHVVDNSVFKCQFDHNCEFYKFVVKATEKQCKMTLLAALCSLLAAFWPLLAALESLSTAVWLLRIRSWVACTVFGVVC